MRDKIRKIIELAGGKDAYGLRNIVREVLYGKVRKRLGEKEKELSKTLYVKKQ